MTHDEFIESARARVAKYLEVRADRRGLDVEQIHSFDNKYELRWSDLNALVCTVAKYLPPPPSVVNKEM